MGARATAEAGRGEPEAADPSPPDPPWNTTTIILLVSLQTPPAVVSDIRAFDRPRLFVSPIIFCSRDSPSFSFVLPPARRPAAPPRPDALLVFFLPAVADLSRTPFGGLGLGP